MSNDALIMKGNSVYDGRIDDRIRILVLLWQTNTLVFKLKQCKHNDLKCSMKNTSCLKTLIKAEIFAYESKPKNRNNFVVFKNSCYVARNVPHATD